MNEQDSIKKFLASSTYNQLSANQQKHAQDILSSFMKHMMEEQHLADTAWTPQAVKDVMVGEFIADPALTNQYGIAVAPVLKAYLTFKKADNLDELTAAIDEQRSAMNECRKAHKTLAQLNGDAPATSSAVKVSENKVVEQKAEVEETVAPRKEVKPLSDSELKAFIEKATSAVDTEAEFKNSELDAKSQKYLISEFITLMVSEYKDYPNGWEFNDLQTVLGMMMPLDPDIKPDQILNIVPTAQALFDYLKRTEQIDMEQYRTALKAIANMQASEEVLAGMSRADRENQLMTSFVRSHGIEPEDVKGAENWMDEHKQEVVDFMRELLHPWRRYDQAQAAKRTSGSVTKHRAPKGIKFRKKARAKKRHKK
ncbi:MAG: hypothetical protein Q3959_02920 [Limosilactobacillus sp.]|uniref:hypothetical protein n=1 Tax=Limosilactobacillus sp. TaxID=2773925 RepID=UPI0027004C75|nr:hypothetical protein [Limosilactobacillus sp.]